MEKRFVYNTIPFDAAQVKASGDAFETAALTVMALCAYREDKEKAIAMLNKLKGPSPLTPFEIQFLRDRLMGKDYKPFSFLEGATPANNYKPNQPYAITVSDNPYSWQNENYAVLWVKSSGADSPREIRLRKKPSTGEWFLVEQMILSDIRIPVAEDPWA